MKIVRFNEGRIGASDGCKVIDISTLCGVVPGEWPPVGINRLIRNLPNMNYWLSLLADMMI